MNYWTVGDIIAHLSNSNASNDDYVIFQHRLGDIKNMKEHASRPENGMVVDDDGYRIFANAPPSLDVIIGILTNDTMDGASKILGIKEDV